MRRTPIHRFLARLSLQRPPRASVADHAVVSVSLALAGILLMVSLPPSIARGDDAKKAPSSLELRVSANDPYSLYEAESITASHPITLSVEADNRSSKSGQISYDWKLTDYWGKTIRSDGFKGQPVSPNATDKTYLSFQLADLKGHPGIYNFAISASLGKEKDEARTAFGVVPAPAKGLKENSMFGAATSVVDAKTTAMLQRIGAKWLRTDAGIRWADCEPTAKGTYDWDRFDRLVSEAEASEIELLPVVGDAPDWAKAKGPDGKPFQSHDAPANVQDHADFLAAAVARYVKEVKYWETWDAPKVMGQTWHASPQLFRDMMKADYEAAKKADPNAVIVASGESASHLRDVVFFPGASMKDDLDETSAHADGVGAPEEDFYGKAQDAVLVSQANGKDKVWIAQGWDLDDATKLARYVPRAYVMAALAGVSHLDWLPLADDTKGLFRKDDSPRAAAVTYAVAAHFLEDNLLVRELWPYSRKIYGAVFKNEGGRKVAVIWAIGDKGSLTIEDGKAVKAYDVMGAEIGDRNGDKLTVSLGEDVVYLTSDEDQAAFLDQVQGATLENIDPVEIAIEPFLAPISETPPLRVEVTNPLNEPVGGDLSADVPNGWKLVSDRVSFGPIQPGETKLIEIPVRQATVSPDNRYPVTVTAESRHRGLQSLLAKLSGPAWRDRIHQALFVAGAVRGTPTIDGDLSDWSSALPLEAKTPEFVGPWTDEKWKKAWTPGNLSATFYAMYDDAYFYVAAKVSDNAHSAVSVAANPYAQPFDGDSLQIAFGTTSVGRPKPTMAATPPPAPAPATNPSGGSTSNPASGASSNPAKPADSAPPTNPGSGSPTNPGGGSPANPTNVPPANPTPTNPTGAPKIANATATDPAGGAAPDSDAGGIPARGILDDTEYEFSLALTPKGPEAFKLRSPASGDATLYPTNPEIGLGLTSDVKLAVKRDDINEITVYEAAIPWSELANIPHDQPFHLAFKLNDKDRGDRVEGWIESSAGAGIARGNELSFSPSWEYDAANLCPWALLKP